MSKNICVIFAALVLVAAADGTRYQYAGGWGRSNPPEMVRYIMDLAVGPDGNLYLLHAGGDREVYVQVFTPAGESLRIFGGHERGLGGGSSRGAIAVGPDGSVYVVGFVAEGVTKFVAGRKFPEVWKWFGRRAHFRFDDVAVAPDGRVYAMDWGDTIERFTAEGRRLEPWGLERPPPGERRPVGPIAGIEVGPAGRLFVADKEERHVPYFERDGAAAGELTWGESEMGPAVDVAVAPDGTVYVTDGRGLCTLAEDGSVVAAWVVDEDWDPYRRRVRGLAAGRDGTVYVGFENVIKCFTRDGVFSGEIDATAPPVDCFDWPNGIAASPEGVVYVADNHNDRVTYFTAEGEPLGCWDKDTVRGADDIYDVAWCPDGTVAVLSEERFEDSPAYVGFYGSKGELIREWPVAAEGVRRRAFELAVAPDGTLYLGTNGDAPRILRFRPDGAYLGAWYVEVEPSIYNGGYVADVAVGPGGTVYVVRSDYYGLLVYTPEGELREERFVEAMAEEFGSKAVAVGPNGDVFLASEAHVCRFDADGELLERWGGEGSAPGRFDEISGLTVAADGTVYVVDEGLERVQYFRP